MSAKQSVEGELLGSRDGGRMARSTGPATIVVVVIMLSVVLRHVRGFERSDGKGGPGGSVAQLYVRTSYRSFSDSGQRTSRDRTTAL